MPGTSGTGPESIARRERMAEALEMRKTGMSYRQIAARLDVSISTAHEYVTTALAEVTKEPAATLLAIELERLESWLYAIEPAISEGDLKAIDRGIRISQRIGKLTGLDALAILRVRNEGREMSAVDQFLAEMLGEKATDEDDS